MTGPIKKLEAEFNGDVLEKQPQCQHNIAASLRMMNNFEKNEGLFHTSGWLSLALARYFSAVFLQFEKEIFSSTSSSPALYLSVPLTPSTNFEG